MSKRLSPELIKALNESPPRLWRIVIVPHSRPVTFNVINPMGKVEAGFLAHPYPFPTIADAMLFIGDKYFP